MHLATPTAVALGLTLLLAAGGVASAQNLVVNGDFDASLAGWSDPAPFVEATWVQAPDAGGSETSGSVFVRNASELEGYAGEIGQCVPISPTEIHRIGGSVYVPGRQTVGGSASILIEPVYDASDCDGPESSGILFAGLATTDGPTDQWLTFEIRVRPENLVPPSVRSGRFSLSIYKPAPTASVGAYFDDLYMIAPEPGATLVGVAALGAVALSAGLRPPRRARAGAPRSPRRRA